MTADEKLQFIADVTQFLLLPVNVSIVVPNVSIVVPNVNKADKASPPAPQPPQSSDPPCTPSCTSGDQDVDIVIEDGEEDEDENVVRPRLLPAHKASSKFIKGK